MDQHWNMMFIHAKETFKQHAVEHAFVLGMFYIGQKIQQYEQIKELYMAKEAIAIHDQFWQVMLELTHFVVSI